MKKKYAYNLDDVGIMPTNFITAYVSGSVGFGTFDDADPNLPAFKCWEVQDYEYAMEPQRIFYKAIEAGYDTGLGYRLAMGDNDRNQWTSLLVLYREANAPDTTELQIADIDGNLHTVTLAQFRLIAIGLGQAYASLWTAYRSAVS